MFFTSTVMLLCLLDLAVDWCTLFQLLQASEITGASLPVQKLMAHHHPSKPAEEFSFDVIPRLAVLDLFNLHILQIYSSDSGGHTTMHKASTTVLFVQCILIKTLCTGHV